MKKKKAFITGIAGFAGSFLAEELLNSGYQVSGSLFGQESLRNVKHLKKDITTVKLDVQILKECNKVLRQIKPDYIFHLAAFSSVGKSFEKERLTYSINFDGTLNLLNSALELKNLKKFIFVSSAEAYGLFNPAGKTLSESQPFNPNSPYAVSKAAAEYACSYYVSRYRLPVAIARSFNHTGPRQSDSFVVSSFARQIAQIEANRAEPTLYVGDLSAKRDFSDVRDIVRGYRFLAERGQPGQAYHFCSGRAVSIGKILDLLLKLSVQTINVKTDRARLRKNDIPVLRGSYLKAKKQLGYHPNFKLPETLKDTLDYWRNEQ